MPVSGSSAIQVQLQKITSEITVFSDQNCDNFEVLVEVLVLL